MAHYYLGNEHHFRQKIARRFKFIVGFFGFLIVVAAVVMAFDTWLQRKESVKEASSQLETRATFTDTSQVMRTAYYQFQAGKNWTLIPSESSEKTYVYRRLNKNLVEQELRVFIGQPQKTDFATHIVPVEIDENSLRPGDISKHCKTKFPSLGQTSNRMPTTMAEVKMICNPSSVEFRVHVGQIGGGTILKMKRPDGEELTYQIQFQDMTVQPSEKDLTSILSSFQTR